MTRLFARTTFLTMAVLTAGVGVDGAAPITPAPGSRSVVHQITIPAGTMLRLRVERGFGSDTSRVEDAVPATLASPVVVGGRTVLREGSVATGYVAQAERSGKVKGRGRVAVRFNRITPAGHTDRYTIQTRPWVSVAPATKKKDAMTIGLPAAGGAIVGGVIGGKKGAGIGALAGGGTGTAVVLTTRGKDVHVARGAVLGIRLTSPVTINVAQ